MGTRLYFHPGNTPPNTAVTPSSWSAGWNRTTGAATRPLLVAPSQATATAGAFNFTASGTSGHFTAVGRWVSPPLLAQTIAGTVKGQIRCLETATTDNFTLAFAIKVIQSDGSDRGVLVGTSASDDTSATPPEMTTVLTNRKFLDSSESAEISLSSLAVSGGDRIVVELGFRQASTSTNAANFSVTANDANTDLGEDNTNTSSTTTPWVEFSQNIDFGIAFYKQASTPAGMNATATGTADPTAVTPPSGVQAGDLVCMVGHQRATGATLAVGQASGQSWTTEAAIGTTNCTARLFWCVFNGTWGSDPSVDFSAATCNSVQLIVFRPPANYHRWSLNQNQVELDIAATANYTITGQTTTGVAPTLTLSGWFTADDNQWSSVTANAGWEDAADLWYINQSGSDQSSSYGWNSKPVPGATGNTTKTITALGNDDATTFIISWAADRWPVAPNVVPQSVQRAAAW